MNLGIVDSLNYIKKFTFKRLFNLFIVRISFYLSKWFKKSIHWGMPVSISIEPTTSCNLRCPQCPSGLRSFSRPTGMLQKELFNKTIDELSGTLTYLTLYFQGEPYLNPHFLDFVRYANQKKIYTATSSNAHHITTKIAEETVLSGLDRLIISIDGTSNDTYKEYRIGGNIEKVLESTKNILTAKKKYNARTPHVLWQFIVFKHNEHQINAFIDLAKQYQVDSWALKSAQIYDYENGSDLIPENSEYSRYALDETYTKGYAIKNKLENECWRMWQGCVITWDGKVVPCCFDKDATHTLGDLQTNSFQEIWKSNQYQDFRTTILTNRKQIDICKNCSEGSKVWT